MSLMIRPSGPRPSLPTRFSGVRENLDALNNQDALLKAAKEEQEQLNALNTVFLHRGDVAVTGADLLELIQQLMPSNGAVLKQSASDAVVKNMSSTVVGGVFAGLGFAPFVSASEGTLAMLIGGAIAVIPPVATFAKQLWGRGTANLDDLYDLLSANERGNLWRVKNGLDQLALVGLLVRPTPAKVHLTPLGLRLLKQHQSAGAGKTATADSFTPQAKTQPVATLQNRSQQLSVLLKQNQNGLTGFELLQRIQKELSGRWFFKNTFSQKDIAQSLTITTETLKGLPELELVGYVSRNGGSTENPKYKLTESAREILSYSSIEALKTAGKITKEDLKGFLQQEIDALREQEAKHAPWLAQLREKLQTAREVTLNTMVDHGEGQATENARRIEKERELQLELAKEFCQKSSDAIQAAILDLTHQQDLLDLNADNAQLLSLMGHPDQVVQGVHQRLQTVLAGIQADHAVNDALISPEEHRNRLEIQARVRERRLAKAADAATATQADGQETKVTLSLPEETESPAAKSQSLSAKKGQA